MVKLIERYLTEDIEAVKKQYSYIPEDEFDMIIRIDPTFKEDRDSVGKYGKWLLGMYKKDDAYISDLLDCYRRGDKAEIEYTKKDIQDTIKTYDAYKNDRTKTIEKDIGKFKTFSDMVSAVEGVGEAELSDKQKTKQAKKDKPYDMVFEGDIFAVFVPRNHAGDMVLASFGNSKKANWCTAADSENGIEMYDKYLKHGGKYYVLINKKNYNEKYQFHFESDQFLNQDNRIGDNYLMPVMMKDPKLWDFFLKEGYEDKIGEKPQKVKTIPIGCVKGASILSTEDYKKYKSNMTEFNGIWWIRPTEKGLPYVFSNEQAIWYMTTNDDSVGVRPVLLIDIQGSEFEVSDKFEFANRIFTILSNDIAICDEIIGECCYREKWDDEYLGNYETSDVKKYVDNWFSQSYNKYKNTTTESYRRIRMKEY